MTILPDATTILQFNPLTSLPNTLCIHVVLMLSICAFPVLDGAALRVDDRLRVAKERREEADKQQGEPGLLLSSVEIISPKSITLIALSVYSVLGYS